MLVLKVPKIELWDEQKEEISYVDETTIKLEHSLISISKWEAKWHIPFMDKTHKKTIEQTIDYIKDMCLTPNVPDFIFSHLGEENYNLITEYITNPMTATWFSDSGKKSTNREVITSELIYYWMVAYNIPSEYQKWHLNRLLTLIQICDRKNQPKKKMSKAEILSSQAALNKARRARYGTSG